MTPSEHDDTVRRSFRRQTGLFERENSPFARRPDSPTAWLEPLDPSLAVLDVACGAAHAAEQVAPSVGLVIGVDLTPELLAIGARRMREAGIVNVVLQEGAATALPFVDESFDVVFCRSALHHFDDPDGAVAEMARVCRRGGRVVVSDVVVPDPRIRVAYDAVHRALDPSHVRAFTGEEIADLLATRVGPIGRAEQRGPAALPLAGIVTEVADLPAVTAALEDELAGGAETGFAPERAEDGQDGLLVSFASVVVHATRA
jgi:SAM-dependent methyltransferase